MKLLLKIRKVFQCLKADIKTTEVKNVQNNINSKIQILKLLYLIMNSDDIFKIIFLLCFTKIMLEVELESLLIVRSIL